jgi:general secretion pathway protein D
MMAEVRDKWSPDSYVAVNKGATDKMRNTKPILISDDKKVRIAEKMKSIIIPELNFRQANIVDVIDFLQRASIDYDTSDSPQEEKGVNIILNLGADAEPVATTSEPDPFSIPTTAVADSSGQQSITFSSRYISLLEALNIVTEISKLKYRIDGSVVMIVPADAPDGKIIVKTYDVLPSVEDKIPSVGNELSMNAGGVGDGFGFGDAGGTEATAVPWKEFFTKMGVKWPVGSQIQYIRSIGKIVVANTEDNLIDFEGILNELNVVPNQIEIEARFVEVNEKDMNSLGFEWFLNDDFTLASKNGNYAPGAAPRVDIAANSASGGFTTGNRFMSDVVTADAANVADSVLSIAGILTNPELGLVIHALEQKGHADLLSSPKVTTQTGQEATIKVVTEYIYPTAYTVTPVTGQTAINDTAVIIGGIVEPQDFQMREVGVILTVQPDVSPEGQMITLNMTPEVVTEPDWKNYGTTYTDQEGNVQQLNMEQPFFHTRLVQTSISIYNGATVVMGGMITEKRVDTIDKIPLLGDIPIIGKFFQSKTSQSEKRNLLIFVTARLVDPAGRPVEDSSADLIADKLQEEADQANQ